jgi:hypothetical protein
MKQVLRLLPGFMLCFLFACDYSPSGSHYQDLDPKPRLQYKINLNEQGDTLYARGTVTYEYTVLTGGRQVHATELWLGERQLHQSITRSGTAKINTAEFAEGYHILRVLVRASTGTGSLADHAGSEQLQVYQTWVVKIENAAPTPTKLISIKGEEGTLRLKWEPYNRRYIKNYIVRRFNNLGQEIKKVTLPPDVTTWDDVHYVGGDSYYSIGVEDQDKRIAESERVFFTAPIPRLLTHEYTNDNGLKLTFSRSRFYSNFGNYYFQLYYENRSNIAEYEITEINDTVLTVTDVPFGTQLQYVLNSVAESFSLYSIVTSDNGTLPGLGVENRFTPFNRSHFSPENNLFYDFSGSELKVIDGNTLEVRHAKSYNSTNLAISSDKRLLYLNTSSGLLRLDPLTLEVVASWKLADLVPLVAYNALYLRVSNTNRLLIYLRNNNGTDRFYVVNMETGAVELNETQTSSIRNATISPDGQMIAAPNILYQKRSDGSWAKQTKPNLNPDVVYYHPTEPLYLTGRYLTSTFYHTITQAPVRTIRLQDEHVISVVDQATGYIVVYDYLHVHIYNQKGDKLLKTVKALGVVQFFKDRLFANDHFLPITF